MAIQYQRAYMRRRNRMQMAALLLYVLENKSILTSSYRAFYFAPRF